MAPDARFEPAPADSPSAGSRGILITYPSPHQMRNAVLRGCVLLVMRCLEQWYAAIPELRKAQHFVAKKRQQPYISPENFPDAWPLICEVLRNVKRA